MLITGKPFQSCTWNIARIFCSGWGRAACRTECMLHSVVIIKNVMTFATVVPISFTSFVYRTNVYWSVIHGIKRKPHLSVAWNWYHFVAIAILHQPRPTDSADINTRLQLSDTSSIQPMHGGFLLISGPWYFVKHMWWSIIRWYFNLGVVITCLGIGLLNISPLEGTYTQIARFMGPTLGPPGSCRPQMGPMLVQWTCIRVEVQKNMTLSSNSIESVWSEKPF